MRMGVVRTQRLVWGGTRFRIAPPWEFVPRHFFPSVLPGGRAVLFTITSAGPIDNAQVAVLDLKTGQRKPLIRGGSQAEYIKTGHLMYAVAGTLRAVRFDPV